MSDNVIDAQNRFAWRIEQAAKALARRQVVERARWAVFPRALAANDKDPDAP